MLGIVAVMVGSGDSAPKDWQGTARVEYGSVQVRE